MFSEESTWIRRALAEVDLAPGGSALDCGSQTLDYRSHEQPYVEQNVMAPLRERGLEVFHLDAKDLPGVDIVQDITATDPDPATTIGRRFDLVICTNLLPNVAGLEPAVANVAGLVAPRGWLLATVNGRYRREPDPIDNLWRPSPPQLAAAFSGVEPSLETVRADSVRIEDPRYYKGLLTRPAWMPIFGGRWWFPWPGFTDQIRRRVKRLQWRQSCVLMRRSGPGAASASNPAH